ncbi:COMM domain-containing protein 9-like [Planoprotostelium fungivorum]|uniref:COMM domain-containing protein 9-like n=1 Tax=Planoprotostelium fungivorum TaxID=1890364 RepID=A0A2P6P0G5_9EUKA|nr:COMM domain-containing protein 9-like [Planoprotostelium fungivorum]
MAEETVGLIHLRKASSKKMVDRILSEVFKTRYGDPPIILVQSLQQALSISIPESVQLVNSARFIESVAVYENSPRLASLFASDFPEELRDLLLEVINSHLKEWRNSALISQPSLPRLKKLDWRVDVKRASESMSFMSVPTVLVQLKVEEPKKSLFVESNERTINFEMNKQLLETMVEGLGKIKAQLSALK